LKICLVRERTAEERRERASEKGLCFKCLKKGHFANNCHVLKIRCVYCGRAHHHSALCERKFGEAKEIQEENKGVSATTTQKEIVAAFQSVERDYYNRPLGVRGNLVNDYDYGLRSEEVSQKILKGGGIQVQTNTSVSNVPTRKNSIKKIKEKDKYSFDEALGAHISNKPLEVKQIPEKEFEIEGEINQNKVVSNQMLEYARTKSIVSPLEDEQRPSSLNGKRVLERDQALRKGR